MTTEEAIWILENGAWWDDLNPDASDADINPLNDALDMAIAALREQEERDNPKPLTLDELREMGGEPVWIVARPDWGHWELSDDAEDYFDDRDPDFYGMEQPNDPCGRYGLHLLGWLAYRHKPKEDSNAKMQ